MSSVYFPAHVVLVLRRIINVISSLSISNQYLLLKKAKAEEDRTTFTPYTANNLKLQSLQSFDDLKGARWPWWIFKNSWNWHRFRLPESPVNPPQLHVLASTTVKDSTFLPWIRRTSSQSTFLSTSVRPDTIQTREPSSTLPNSPKKDQPVTPKKFPPQRSAPLDIVHQLMQNPALYDPLRTPRYPIVLCHGLYGFDSRGPLKFPSMRMHYWSNVLNILRDTVRAEVIVTSVPGTGSIISRAEALDRQLQHKARGRGINFLAHSMGGLDCRHLITHIKPEEYAPLSLTTISTPHRGSPFMDWCAENIGLGKLHQHRQDLAGSRNPDLTRQRAVTPPPSAADISKPKPDTPFSLSLSSLPSSFTTFLLSIVDFPAYANLTSKYLNNVFNPATPDDPTVKYFSVAGRMNGVSIWHPFWLPKMVLDGVEGKHRERLRAIWEQNKGFYGPRDLKAPLWAHEEEWGNDGLVTVQSAKWGEFLGTMEGCDHWEMRGARGIEFGVDLPAIPIIGLGVSTSGHRSAAGDSWGFPDWGRFVSTSKKGENAQHDAAAKPAGVTKTHNNPEERERQRDRDDAIIKSSTDKLSAVLDWLTDQVPSPPLLGIKNKAIGETDARTLEGVAEMKVEEGYTVLRRQKHELATKKDLERFYVALTRRLYDEGL